MNQKRTIVRVPVTLIDTIRQDLTRKHPFASERVGFCTGAVLSCGGADILVVREYFSLSDDSYLCDTAVGARISTAAINSMLASALHTGDIVLHVHWHPHAGVPQMSATDAAELPRLMHSVSRVNRSEFNAILILSDDSAAVFFATSGGSGYRAAERVVIVGGARGLELASGGMQPATLSAGERLSRQGFLGRNADGALGGATVAVLGLGGGGSHIALQLAHLGVGRMILCDPDYIEESNLNRTVTAGAQDVSARTLKVAAAARRIWSANPEAEVTCVAARWQEHTDELLPADIVVGCVDSFAERRDLEVFARRALQPLIDIGMDVHANGSEPPRLVGQLIMSLPGHRCMRCLGFITEENLVTEAAAYGVAGGRPQVVWANGILASLAVGLVAELVTGWQGRDVARMYLSYDGNASTVGSHPRLQFGPESCTHFPVSQSGPARYERLAAG